MVVGVVLHKFLKIVCWNVSLILIFSLEVLEEKQKTLVFDLQNYQMYLHSQALTDFHKNDLIFDYI